MIYTVLESCIYVHYENIKNTYNSYRVYNNKQRIIVSMKYGRPAICQKYDTIIFRLQFLPLSNNRESTVVMF